MKSYKNALATASCLAILAPAYLVPAYAAEQPVNLPYRSGVEIEYAVTSEDSAATIRQRMLRDDIRWVHITQLNGLATDSEVVPGQVLRIPVTWLRYGPKYATVDAISGDVRVNGKPADRNSKFTEDDLIDTDSDGTVIIVLPDGTEMQIAPGSSVRIERLRQYFDGDTIDARLRLERGQIRSDSPEFLRRGRAASQRDIRIQTPKATAAVRGTQFRVSDDDDVSASSVLGGKVNWQASQGATDLPKGFGASANANGTLTPPEVLLAAPRVRTPEQALSTTSTEVRFDPIPGAVAYRVKIAANTAFSNDLTERVVTEPLVRVDSQRDGNHFIAIRGISSNGVDGLDGIGKLTFLARPVAPGLELPADQDSQLADGTLLTWAANPNASGYRVQIADDPDFGNLMVDTETESEQFEFRRAADRGEPIRGYWRVAAIDGWTTGPFSDVRQFVLETMGPKPSVQEDDNGQLIQWPAVPGASYSLEVLDRDDPNGKIARTVNTADNSIRVDGLPAGRFEARVIARFADSGLASRRSDAAEFVVRRAWRNRFGDPVGTSDGSLQISQ